jgi:hypothetical protein
MGVSIAAHGPEPSARGDLTPRQIRAALLPEEAGDFDREYRRTMAEATETLDLNPVLELLERWRRVAWSSQDPAAHQRMLDTAAALNAGEPVATESWQQVKARLGL